MEKEIFGVCKIANLVYLVKECLQGDDEVYGVWDEREFTEKKLQNALKKIQSNHNRPVEVVEK